MATRRDPPNEPPPRDPNAPGPPRARRPRREPRTREDMREAREARAREQVVAKPGAVARRLRDAVVDIIDTELRAARDRLRDRRSERDSGAVAALESVRAACNRVHRLVVDELEAETPNGPDVVEAGNNQPGAGRP